MRAISLEDVIMFCFLWAVGCSSVLCDILGFPGVDWRYKEEAVTRYGGGCGEGVVVLLELKGPKIKLIVMRTKTDFERGEVLGSSNAKRINNLPVDVEAVPPTVRD
ncbi:hypothetical protein YC2023_060317 [Brassica napus]